MSYDISGADRDRAQLAESAPGVFEVGTVTKILGGNKLWVNAAGTNETVWAVVGLVVANNDLVLLARSPGTCWAIAKLPRLGVGNMTPIPQPFSDVRATGTMTILAEDSGSYRNGVWRTDTKDVIQGTSTEPSSIGAWFYGSTPEQLLEGYTVTGLRIKVYRQSAGVRGKQTAHFYMHSSHTRPVGDVVRTGSVTNVDLEVGDSSWVALPPVWGLAIITSGGGISIAGEPFVSLAGITTPDSGALQIDWSR